MVKESSTARSCFEIAHDITSPRYILLLPHHAMWAFSSLLSFYFQKRQLILVMIPLKLLKSKFLFYPLTTVLIQSFIINLHTFRIRANSSSTWMLYLQKKGSKIWKWIWRTLQVCDGEWRALVKCFTVKWLSLFAYRICGYWLANDYSERVLLPSIML